MPSGLSGVTLPQPNVSMPLTTRTQGARVNFEKLLREHNGEQSLIRLADILRLSTDEVWQLVNTTSPIFVKGVRSRISTDPGRTALRRLVETGGPQQYISKPHLMDADVSRVEGEAYLRDIVAPVIPLTALITHLHENLGIQPRTLEMAMPRLACLFVGAVCQSITLKTA